ncbi:MAG TPA: alpha/beta fold hydrolase [Thermoanaerobaculia bacterium]|nr:alpha/beta fold hydrolase [Thermoanaerobaculia bacterium]
MPTRTLTLAFIAALLLSACTTTTSAPPRFVSDRISVDVRGSGPDVVLIPGLTGHREIWSDVAETLDDRYRLHLVQVNGFAGVPAGANAEGAVAAPVAEELARYIREAGLQRPAVIGHSMGGTIGMMLAARHPNTVGRLMVVDMVPFMGAMFGPAAATPEGLRTIADQTRTNILGSPLDQGFLSQMFSTMTMKADMVPMLTRHLRESDRNTVANAFHELIVTDLRPELSLITAPVTVLYVVPAATPVPVTAEQHDASMKQLYANAAGARLLRIDDSRHFIHWDQPSRFVTEVDAFMK